jgi:hypothetical protein
MERGVAAYREGGLREIQSFDLPIERAAECVE